MCKSTKCISRWYESSIILKYQDPGALNNHSLNDYFNIILRQKHPLTSINDTRTSEEAIVAEVQKSSQHESGVIAYSLDEYRNKLEEIILTENDKFRLLAEQQAKEIISEAQQKADKLIAQSQRKTAEYIGNSEQKAAQIVSDSYKKAESIVNEHKQKALTEQNEIINIAHKEALKITETANQEAQRIVAQAEENAKKDAKNRMKSEAEKIIVKAREESDSIISGARQEATKIISNGKKETDQQALNTIDKLKKEADSLIKNEIEKCSAEARTQSNQIRLAAKNDAEKLINNIIKNSTQVHVLIEESMKNTEEIMAKASNDVQTELNNLATRIIEIKKKLDIITDSFVQENTSAENAVRKSGNLNTSDSFWLTLKGKRSGTGTGENGYYKGEIELKALSPFNPDQIKIVKKMFTQIPSVKYLGEFSSEEGIQMSYDLQEKLPLVDILKKMLTIENIEKEGDNLKLSFRY
jgi:vacuolar-type H+-ATPase subunit H